MSQWPQQGYSGQQGYAQTGGQNTYGSAGQQREVCPCCPSLALPCWLVVCAWRILSGVVT